ncbi:diguanylate cyclase [Alteromonadaceae bacterium M269]|nr:diguanylate cyclase [Alteromonadaceae bacterium M269]
MTFHDQSIKVTASFGVVEINDANLHIEKVIDTADKALYQAKDSGRNRVIKTSF